MNSGRYYIYAYLREDKTPYYIGKGSGQRINLKHPRKGGADLPLPPLDRRIIIKRFDSETECYAFEKWMVGLYGREIDGGILNNIGTGGAGARCDTTDNKFDINEYWKEYYQTNKERISKKDKDYYQRNKEKIKQRRRERYYKQKGMV